MRFVQGATTRKTCSPFPIWNPPLKIKRLFTLSLLVFASSITLLADAQPDAASDADAEEQARMIRRFNRDWLEAHAKELSLQAHEPKTLAEDDPLASLSYDQYRAIQFQRGAGIWARQDRGFLVGLLHPGFLFKTPVAINLVVRGVSRRVLYEPKVFNYGNDSEVVKGLKSRGYSGFRVNTEINKDGTWDEFLVFQGGSYFRALGKNNWYGLSARGLAINTAQPKGEEFPAFTEFWIERPRKNAASIVVHALLESKSLTGAYTFTAVPGENTKIKVKATLYPRTKIAKFGVAPLTSMFLFDATDRTRFDDFRPAVHDSNGLMILNSNGERIWRPLANPKRLQASSFRSGGIKGFGLMQRSRDFEDFEDGEAKYEQRPSLWIEPDTEWVNGHVELIEIPTDKETNDNIVAFWNPDTPLQPNTPVTLSYSLTWGASPIQEQPGKILATRSGLAVNLDSVRDFIVDFDAEGLPNDVKVNVESSNGNIIDARGYMLEVNGRYRTTFKFEPAQDDLTEFRLWLSSKDKPWGETWLYRWTR